ncbi:hypothetical protein ASE67_15735 [Sphingomonas sp. Leaf23]|uniref:DUF4163 domain-containing protein n=1 Tax=Sphingomonas sp. Leaf23 TaxID=1735689 RepID=UPI0006FD9AC6|nr:DUF4163 domain-containing protein [Sphingomonas sp. Leaf23]KQM85114.1 hypothetical protein ASE67_15735 [Sphingomonas sp. Leaf23]
MTRMILLGLALAASAASAQAPRTSANYDFVYTYPSQAARIAPLKAWLDADKAKLRAKVAGEAAAFRRETQRDGSPFRKYDASKEWQVVADTPRFLSLSVATYDYSGGAHGYGASGGLLWDKRAAKRIEPKAVFVSVAGLDAALRKPWCDWLKRERVNRLGSASGTDDIFGQCPRVKELAVLLGSSSGKGFDRIGLIADQYVAGSYAEGPYEVTLPVTPAVLRAVKPEYRAAFVVR